MFWGKYNKSIFGTRKIEERTKDIPLEGNLVAATYILTYGEALATPSFDVSLPAALLVKWYSEGKVRLQDGFFAFSETSAPTDKIGKNYYELFCQAAEERRVIEDSHEVFKAFYERFTKVPNKDTLFEEGLGWFKKHGYIAKQGLIAPTLSDAGATDARRLISLRNYLKDVKDGAAVLDTDNGHLAEYVAYAILFAFDDIFVANCGRVLPKDLVTVYENAMELAQTGYNGYYEATDGLEGGED
mgnify:CR=1 FL=1